MTDNATVDRTFTRMSLQELSDAYGQAAESVKPSAPVLESIRSSLSRRFKNDQRTRAKLDKDVNKHYREMQSFTAKMQDWDTKPVSKTEEATYRSRLRESEQLRKSMIWVHPLSENDGIDTLVRLQYETGISMFQRLARGENESKVGYEDPVCAAKADLFLKIGKISESDFGRDQV